MIKIPFNILYIQQNMANFLSLILFILWTPAGFIKRRLGYLKLYELRNDFNMTGS